MNRYVRILVAIVIMVFGALTAGSGIFGAASNPQNAGQGFLVAGFGAVAVAAGIWIGVSGADDAPEIGGGRSAGRAAYLLIAAVTGVLALVSLAYFFTGIGDSTRPEQDGGVGFMPVGLVGMILFGSANVLSLVAWLGARRS